MQKGQWWLPPRLPQRCRLCTDIAPPCGIERCLRERVARAGHIDHGPRAAIDRGFYSQYTVPVTAARGLRPGAADSSICAGFMAIAHCRGWLPGTGEVRRSAARDLRRLFGAFELVFMAEPAALGLRRRPGRPRRGRAFDTQARQGGAPPLTPPAPCRNIERPPNALDGWYELMPEDQDRWTFLTNLAHVLLCLAKDPGIRLSDVAAEVRAHRARCPANRERAGASGLPSPASATVVAIAMWWITASRCAPRSPVIARWVTCCGWSPPSCRHSNPRAPRAVIRTRIFSGAGSRGRARSWRIRSRPRARRATLAARRTSGNALRRGVSGRAAAAPRRGGERCNELGLPRR